ncbi:TetR family transcriptional regulator [Labrys miyagiensis]|uniref:TetR family transcriptional regulator n=1 Tax=Labrys miyagiensis TaxID=346912 RepID=A0ABQ6CL26_9HYPH|nr:TetR/AcrR family transcriptional regulator [Labrys miyagiensis]GLS19585.1 TetR family transcriptional regulator [Labrys miyagiensis]
MAQKKAAAHKSRAANRSKPTAAHKRPRNAVATREAILQSALLAFSRAGYDGVGLREIAGEAGVTAILVNRYFGSKEEMFVEAVKITFADTSLFSGDAASIADRVAQAMVGKADEDKPDAIRLMLHSASNPRAATILREALAGQFERPLAAMLGGRDTGERAALFLALIAGFDLIRNVVGSAPLTEADQPGLARRIATMLKPLVEDKQGKKTDKPQQLTLFG